jgi:hypothetical protein
LISARECLTATGFACPDSGSRIGISKKQLVDRARESGADDSIVSAVSRLPSEQYDGPDTVMERLGR